MVLIEAYDIKSDTGTVSDKLAGLKNSTNTRWSTIDDYPTVLDEPETPAEINAV